MILVFCCSSVFAADEGKPAPEITAKLFNGENFSLHSSGGKVVILHFWASWCEACKNEMPILDTYYRKHHNEGLRIIAINFDENGKHEAAEDIMKKFNFDAGFAGLASIKSLGRVWKMPLNFLIDRKGILIKDGWNVGRILSNEDLESTVTPLLKNTI